MEPQRDAVYVLDEGDRRHSSRTRRSSARDEGAGAHLIASVTFIAILMTILIQAPTSRWLGGKLALLDEGE
jgi:hypothetical protein